MLDTDRCIDIVYLGIVNLGDLPLAIRLSKVWFTGRQKKINSLS